MTRKEYIDAYEDGALAMREAIKANIKNLQARLHVSAEYNLSDLDKIFDGVYSMADVRVGDEPDKEDPHAEKTEQLDEAGKV